MIRYVTFPVLLCLFFASCRFKQESIHFVVKTPAGWVRTDTVKSDGSKESLFKPATGDTIYTKGQNIAVIASKYDDIDDFMDKVYGVVKTKTSFYKEIKRKKTVLNGYDARWTSVVLSFPSNPDVRVEQKSYFVADRGMIFMIMCTTPQGGMVFMQDKFYELLKSFKTETDSK